MVVVGIGVAVGIGATLTVGIGATLAVGVVFALAVGAGEVLAGFHRDPRCLGPLLGEAHRGDLRVGVHAAGHHRQVQGGLLAQDGRHGVLPLGTGHVGQLDVPGLGVPDDIDVGHAGAAIGIPHNASPVQLQREVRADDFLLKKEKTSCNPTK